MTTPTKPQPLPWRVKSGRIGGASALWVEDANGNPVTGPMFTTPESVRQAHASHALLVRSANNAEDLADSLNWKLPMRQDCGPCKRAKGGICEDHAAINGALGLDEEGEE